MSDFEILRTHNYLLDRLINQLDALILFLETSQEEVFDFMRKERYNWVERYIWVKENQQNSFPDSYDIFSSQIALSAFLLGYSYSEAFLADLIKEIYRTNPRMLSKDKHLKFNEITQANAFDEVVEIMIKKEIDSLFYKSMEAIIKCFEEKLKLEWTDEQKNLFIRGSLMRNCIMHNGGLVDIRLEEKSDYEMGEEIKLNADNVHSFGIILRGLAQRLYTQATERYFDNNVV